MQCNCDYILNNDKQLTKHYDNCATVWIERNPDKKYPLNENGTLDLPNANLRELNKDVLYHLGLDTSNYDLPAMFGDVKFVCMGGTKSRMRDFAEYLTKVHSLDTNGDLVNLIKKSQRYAMYKVGPVLSVSHGIGIPSMTTLLQEMIKLMYYAKARDPIFLRIGTSGGLGVPPGSVVVSSWGLNGTMEKTYEIPVLGEIRKFPAYLDKRLSEELSSLSEPADGFQTFLGGTMAADDFYRGQARLDGPFCDYTKHEKLSFLNKLFSLGVRNIEMEATAFSAYTREAGIRGGIVCVTLLDRLHGDQVTTSKDLLTQWQNRPMVLVGRFISAYLKRSDYISTNSIINNNDA